MSEICVDPPKPEDMNIDRYKPRARIETVPERFQVFLPSLAYRHSSAVFRHMLETFSKSAKLSAEDKWWDVLVSVWQQTENEWQHACTAMKSGEITFQETEKLFFVIETSSDRFEKCEMELRKMVSDNEDDHWVKVRIKQFQCLSGINSKITAAGILCKIKEDFGFSGDMEDIRKFQAVVS